MTITVPRPKLNWRERLYLPAIAAGLAITLKHFKNMLLGRTKVTMQYPEQKWDSHLPDHYRGAPALVRDAGGRVRCVACQLCEFMCPPRAIKIIPGEIPPRDRFAKVEKFPQEFDINMIRCIYCGMCEEVCPEQAIFLRKDYAITGFTRADMVHHKEKLLEIGGVMHGVVLKWNEKKKSRSSRAKARDLTKDATSSFRCFLARDPSLRSGCRTYGRVMHGVILKWNEKK